MKLPRTIKVNGVVYQVHRKTREQLCIYNNGFPVDGLCVYDESKIYINEGLAPAQQWPVFLHEAGHAAFRESGAIEVLRDHTAHPKRVEELLLCTFLPAYCTAMGLMK